jgi:FkbM family methyltransferase
MGGFFHDKWHRLTEIIATFRNFPTLIFFFLTRGRLSGCNPRAVLRNGIAVFLEPRSVDSGRAIVQEVWRSEIYELPPAHQKFKTVVDVGANIGAFSLFAASRMPDATVYSFEPGDTAYQLLTKNIEHNQFSGRILAFNEAVAGIGGERTFMNSGTASSRSSLFEDEFLNTSPTDAVKVNARGFCELFDSLGISFCDYLKVDCEGAEFEMFDAVTPELLSRIGHIGMEYHEKLSGRNIQDIFSKLEAAGFSVKTAVLNAEQGLGILTASRETR